MITVDQIKHLAKLARLELGEEEIAGFSKDLSAILGYVENLKKVDVRGVLPTSHAVDVSNVTREDKQTVVCDEETIANMIKQAPAKEDGYVKVKAVL